MNVGAVLDTGCVVAYMRGDPRVGMLVAERADLGQFVIVPALCLMEAYRGAAGDEHHRLDVLRSLENVDTPPVEADDCAVVGGWARALGSLDLAHAALEAASRPIVAIVTTEPKMVQQVLAPGWPIVALDDF